MRQKAVSHTAASVFFVGSRRTEGIALLVAECKKITTILVDDPNELTSWDYEYWFPCESVGQTYFLDLALPL